MRICCRTRRPVCANLKNLRYSPSHCFDFDADDVSVLVFDDDVDLVVVSVPKVVELEMAAVPGGQLEQFGKHEGFKQRPKTTLVFLAIRPALSLT